MRGALGAAKGPLLRQSRRKEVWENVPRHGRKDQAREQMLCLKLKGANWKTRSLERQKW